jgi:hypothetical protein
MANGEYLWLRSNSVKVRAALCIEVADKRWISWVSEGYSSGVDREVGPHTFGSGWIAVIGASSGFGLGGPDIY